MPKRLSTNTLALLISNGGSAFLSFLLAVLIGRFYGETGLGTYASVLAWIFPLSFLVEFGFGTLITRDVAQTPQLAPHFIRLTGQFRLIVGGIIILGILLVSTSNYSDMNFLTGLQISAPLILILPAYSTYTAIFRAHQRMIPIAFLNLGMLIAQVILTGIVILSTMPLTTLFIVNTVTSLGQLGVAIWIYQRYFRTKEKSVQNLHLRQLITQARPFAIAAIISALQARFSIIWLESNSTPIIVGYFVAALRFVDASRMIPNALFGAIYPALAQLANQADALKRLFIRIMAGLFLYSLIVACLFLFAGQTIVSLTFGESFVPSTSALALLGIGLIPSLLRSGWILYWYALGRESLVNRLLIFNLILIVICTIFLTKISSMLIGTVMGIVIAEALTLALMVIIETNSWHDKKITS